MKVLLRHPYVGSITVLFFWCMTSAIAQTSSKIPIAPKRWYQVNNTSNGLDGLFDGIINVPVNTGYGKLLSNYDAYYPLQQGEQMSIQSIRFYDGQNTNIDAPLTLYIINDQWQRIPIARFIGDQYQAWVGPDPTHPTTFSLTVPITNARYLVINTSGAYPDEMELYGTYVAGQAPALTSAGRPTSFNLALGANGFEWNLESAEASWQIDESRIPPLKGFSAIRHYIDWEKLESQQGQYTYNPTLSGSWNYDVMYQRCQQEGIEVLACIKTIPSWLQNTYPVGQRDNENVPASYGSNLSLPTSYTEQAKVCFQFAARYGSNTALNPTLVKVSNITTWAGTNTVKIGLGLIRYIECENERDKTWKGRNAYQSGREYAANLSAFYDGHKNTLGSGVGVKNADPSMKVVIGGLAASTTDYVRAMIDWCREFRGYLPDGRINLCWDVINQHLYANNAQSSQGGGGTRGAAPELAGVGQQAAAFVTLSRQYANDMPIWITEAGYDINQGSPFKAIAIGSKSVMQTQAEWILRTALLYKRVGIDRLFFYELYDDNIDNATQFASMGLINGNKTRKPAADYLYQARQLIGNHQYKETINQDPLVDRYELNGRSSYVLTIPDETGRTGTYSLPITQGDTAKIYTPAIGSDNMTRVTQVSTTGTVTVNVSETPVFVLISPRTATSTCPTTLTLTTSVTSGTLNAQAAQAIFSTATISSPANVTYKTASSVKLQTGFKASSGAYFRAYLGTCTSGARIAAQETVVEDILLAYPNPATEEVAINYQLVSPGRAGLYLANANGQTMKTLVEERYHEAGTYTERLNLSQFQAGLYLYILRGDQVLQAKKLIIQK